MISVKTAEELILKHTTESNTDSIYIENLQEEVLREPLIADRSYPPFNRVAMDGIAISTSAWEKGIRTFNIENCQKAGEPQKTLKNESNCLEVMTGAVLPKGCNAVIRYEDIQIENQNATVNADIAISNLLNVHKEGSDYKKGDLLVSSHTLMSAPHWSIAASIGKETVKISQRPTISIISTGDELVVVGETPQSHQVRISNSYTLLSSLRSNGFNKVTLSHIKDDPKEILSQLKIHLENSDIVILSGGVSMGKYDFIPQCLSDLKVKEIFHKVKQKPGKPLWFGITTHNKLVFGLPGNPVSSLICLHRYVLPALWKQMGQSQSGNNHFAALEEEIIFKKNMTYFLPVKVRHTNKGQLLAKPIRSNGSGDFASLIESDGFLELTEEQEVFPSGSAHPLYLWRM